MLTAAWAFVLICISCLIVADASSWIYAALTAIVIGSLWMISWRANRTVDSPPTIAGPSSKVES